MFLAHYLQDSEGEEPKKRWECWECGHAQEFGDEEASCLGLVTCPECKRDSAGMPALRFHWNQRDKTREKKA